LINEYGRKWKKKLEADSWASEVWNVRDSIEDLLDKVTKLLYD